MTDDELLTEMTGIFCFGDRREPLGDALKKLLTAFRAEPMKWLDEEAISKIRAGILHQGMLVERELNEELPLPPSIMAKAAKDKEV